MCLFRVKLFGFEFDRVLPQSARDRQSLVRVFTLLGDLGPQFIQRLLAGPQDGETVLVADLEQAGNRRGFFIGGWDSG